MISLTPVASTKVKEIMQMQSPVPVALRVAAVVRLKSGSVIIGV